MHGIFTATKTSVNNTRCPYVTQFVLKHIELEFIMHNRHNTIKYLYVSHVYTLVRTSTPEFIVLLHIARRRSHRRKNNHEHVGPLSTVTVIIIVTVYGHSKALNTKLMERHMLKFLHFGLEFSLNSEARRVSNSHC